MKPFDDLISEAQTAKYPMHSLHEGMLPVPSVGRKEKNWKVILITCFLAGILICAMAIELARQKPSLAYGPSIGPVQPPTETSIPVGGLVMSVQVTAGPYFLSELLAVDMTVSNPTNISYSIQGVLLPHGFCVSTVLEAYLQGGGNPTFSIPAEGFISTLRCPGGGPRNTLASGQKYTIRQYVPIEKSGNLLLKVASQFVPKTDDNGQFLPIYWLTVPLKVAVQVPTNRVAQTHSDGSQITITAPQLGSAQYAALYAADCQQPDDCGNYSWAPLSTNMLSFPNSSLKIGSWLYAVGTGGYAIAIGAL